MGNQPGGMGGPGRGGPPGARAPPKRRRPDPNKVMARNKAKKGTEAGNKLPIVFPATKCRLRALKLDRIKDYLLMEEEFVEAQNEHRKQKNANTAIGEEEIDPELKQVEDMREAPLALATIEEFIDEDHAIISSAYGPDYYVAIYSFVDRDRLENGSTVLCDMKSMNVVGILNDNTDPMLNAMKVEVAPKECYGDVGGLETQIMELKEAVELPLTHPEV